MTSQDTAATSLKRTPLYEEHRALGARLVEFGGWEMPVQYSGILEEHGPCAHTPVSSMSATWVNSGFKGRARWHFLQHLVPNDVSRLAINQALYTQLCPARWWHGR